MVDPVDVLLATGPVKRQLFLLAASAIATTIIGSLLALQSAFDDLVSCLRLPGWPRIADARSPHKR